ncbi:uncharacterized protein L201_006359 [Kwoniella dendrophila CBS 6074]|uniref:Uncharacterized protein n=1 Tax=Kwoniella dendrophila CBS 6074 TaxID=1295534 RepID=A0AAX4K2K7_9TREE
MRFGKFFKSLRSTDANHTSGDVTTDTNRKSSRVSSFEDLGPSEEGFIEISVPERPRATYAYSYVRKEQPSYPYSYDNRKGQPSASSFVDAVPEIQQSTNAQADFKKERLSIWKMQLEVKNKCNGFTETYDIYPSTTPRKSFAFVNDEFLLVREGNTGKWKNYYSKNQSRRNTTDSVQEQYFNKTISVIDDQRIDESRWSSVGSGLISGKSIMGMMAPDRSISMKLKMVPMEDEDYDMMSAMLK